MTLSSHRRISWPRFALILALMLPLQSFAAAAYCEHAAMSGGGPSAMHEHCAHHADHTQTSQQRHGCCSDCCAAALVAPGPECSTASILAELTLPASRAPVTVTLDRLDRPPRNLA